MCDTAPTPTLLSLATLSERFDVPVSTLRWYIREGRLPAVKIGGRIKVAEDDALALLAPVTPTGRTSAAIAAIVDAAPTLSDAQREALAVALRGGAR